MPLFKKASLSVKKYISPDGEIEVTPERLKHWAEQRRLMNEAGLGIPVGWDHSDIPAETIPVALSTVAGKKRSAKNAAGWLTDIEVGTDGAELTLDIPLDDDAKKVAANLVEVSPIIHREWKDGTGRVWKDVITHVDLVHHPVDAGQGEFRKVEEPQAIACGLRMSLGTGKTAKISQVYRMADDSDTVVDNDPPAPPADDNPNMPADENKSDVAKNRAAIVAYLAKWGVVVPADSADSDEDQFTRDLLTALMTKDATDAKAADEPEDEPEDENMPGQLTESSPQFAAMSLALNRMNHERITRELKELLDDGKITKAEFDQHTPAVAAIRMSLDASGQPATSDVEKFIASRKGLPKGAALPFQNRLRMANVTETEPPAGTIGDTWTEADADQAVDQMFGRKTAKAS